MMYASHLICYNITMSADLEFIVQLFLNQKKYIGQDYHPKLFL